MELDSLKYEYHISKNSNKKEAEEKEKLKEKLSMTKEELSKIKEKLNKNLEITESTQVNRKINKIK